MLKKIALIVLVIIPVLLLSLTTTKDDVSKNMKKFSITLVNEDQGTVLGDKQVNFGSEVVDLISKETTFNVNVNTRDKAISQLEAGKTLYVVVIEKDFSEKTTQINSTDPTPINMTYIFNHAYHGELEKYAKEELSHMLDQVNGELTALYFKTVVDKVDESKNVFKDVLDKEVVLSKENVASAIESNLAIQQAIDNSNENLSLLGETTSELYLSNGNVSTAQSENNDQLEETQKRIEEHVEKTTALLDETTAHNLMTDETMKSEQQSYQYMLERFKEAQETYGGNQDSLVKISLAISKLNEEYGNFLDALSGAALNEDALNSDGPDEDKSNGGFDYLINLAHSMKEQDKLTIILDEELLKKAYDAYQKDIGDTYKKAIDKTGPEFLLTDNSINIIQTNQLILAEVIEKVSLERFTSPLTTVPYDPIVPLGSLEDQPINPPVDPSEPEPILNVDHYNNFVKIKELLNGHSVNEDSTLFLQPGAYSLENMSIAEFEEMYESLEKAFLRYTGLKLEEVQYPIQPSGTEGTPIEILKIENFKPNSFYALLKSQYENTDVKASQLRTYTQSISDITANYYTGLYQNTFGAYRTIFTDAAHLKGLDELIASYGQYISDTDSQIITLQTEAIEKYNVNLQKITDNGLLLYGSNDHSNNQALAILEQGEIALTNQEELAALLDINELMLDQHSDQSDAVGTSFDDSISVVDQKYTDLEARFAHILNEQGVKATYYESYKTILENSKVSGVDNSSYYDYVAQPIAFKGTSTEAGYNSNVAFFILSSLIVGALLISILFTARPQYFMIKMDKSKFSSTQESFWKKAFSHYFYFQSLLVLAGIVTSVFTYYYLDLPFNALFIGALLVATALIVGNLFVIAFKIKDIFARVAFVIFIALLFSFTYPLAVYNTSPVIGNIISKSPVYWLNNTLNAYIYNIDVNLFFVNTVLLLIAMITVLINISYKEVIKHD